MANGGRVLRRERRRQTRVAGCSEPRQRRQEDPRARQQAAGPPSQSGGPSPGRRGGRASWAATAGAGARGGGNGGGANFPAGARASPPGGAGGCSSSSRGFGNGGDPPVFGNQSPNQPTTQGGTSSGATGVKFPLPKPAPGSPLLGGAQNNQGGSPAKNLPAPKFGVDPATAGGVNAAAQAQAQAQAAQLAGDPKPADAEDRSRSTSPGWFSSRTSPTRASTSPGGAPRRDDARGPGRERPAARERVPQPPDAGGRDVDEAAGRAARQAAAAELPVVDAAGFG